MKKKWNIKESDPVLQAKLAQELGIHPLLAQVLINRGVTEGATAKCFLNGGISSLHDPLKLKDMAKAVKRIHQALDKKEKMLVFGDYDVDGITACALVKSALLRMGGDVIHYIPHRVNEGYGLNANAVKLAKEKNVKLLITVDCGINSHKEVAYLNKHGVDTIITDHHQPQNGKLPEAHCIINPKQKDCSYPCKDLAAVGIAYKLAQGLMGEDLNEYLDLVSLGTVADVMSLQGENRILVKEGLKNINANPRLGINALIDACGLKGKEIQPGFISYILGPRINAGGRVDSAENALKLILSQDVTEAQGLAKQLNKYNKERQKIEEKILDEALNIIESQINFKEHRVIVLGKEGWHPGVLGIIASKIADRFYRPTIIISTDKGMGKGSGRSIEKFHLFDALTKCSQFLEEFGGHRHAAGIKILEANIGKFREAINSIAKDALCEEDLYPCLDIDAQIPLSMLTPDLVVDIEQLGPFGEGNPYPVFCCRDLQVKSRPTIMGKDTIKFWVSDGKLTCQVVGFGMGNLFDTVSNVESLDIVFSPSIDRWSGDSIVQLELEDVKIN